MKTASGLLVLAGVAAGVLASCGGKISCGADASAQCTSSGPTVDCTKTVCPNDPAFTTSQIDQCRAELNGSCGSKYVAVYQCILPLVRCDASGKTDTDYVLMATAKCTTELQTYQACKSVPPPTSDAGFK